jgi:hypothetical protein
MVEKHYIRCIIETIKGSICVLSVNLERKAHFLSPARGNKGGKWG